jgi:hypothetical protein
MIRCVVWCTKVRPRSSDTTGLPSIWPLAAAVIFELMTLADQEKAIVYNKLVANAVVLQNVIDQTNALHLLRSEGAPI